MSSNSMGGKRSGKKYNKDGNNFEEDSDWLSTIPQYSRLSEFEQLLADYKRDKKFIKSQKRKWLEPKGRHEKR